MAVAELNRAGAIADRSTFHAGGRVGFLLVHGLGGTPVELRFVAQGLARAGHTVSCCQLAGHCGSHQDLRFSSWQEWYQSVEEAHDRLRQSCDVVIAGDLRLIWRQLGKAHGLAEPEAADGSVAAKIAARQAVVEAWFARFDSLDALHAALTKAALAWGDVKTPAQALGSPTLAHRATITTVDDRAGGRRAVFRAPQRFSTLETAPAGPAPYRGEHNAEVLADWLGRDVAEVPAGVLLAES